MDNFQVENREWWVQRWLELLDSYRFKKRLERARNYAREGNVLSIEFEGSQVLAKVQGTDVEPYELSICLTPFTDEDWDYIIETMSQKAIFSAELLAGQMPENIEEVFIANGLSLFPFSLSEISSRCSCPDKANPCKHIGAVYYQLGDRFSEDPFILFQLRGRTKGQIIEALRKKRNQGITAESSAQKTTTRQEDSSKKTSKKNKQFTIDLQQFWQYDEPLESSLVAIVPPPENKTVLDILGNIPLPYEDSQGVKQFLIQVYQTVSQKAMLISLNQGTNEMVH